MRLIDYLQFIHRFFYYLKICVDLFLQEVTYLQERCSVLEDQIEQHISNEEKYENQINNLIKSVNELQNQVNSTSTEKETVIGDLYAVRELCVRLDQTRGELTKKLAEKTTQHEKVFIQHHVVFYLFHNI